MLTFIKITLYGLIALQFLNSFIAEDVKENLNNNITGVKHEILPKNVTFNDFTIKENILPANKQEHAEKVAEIEDMPHKELEEKQDLLNPLTSEETSLSSSSSNRTGRQLYYSPNFYYIQNFGAEGSKCVTTRGLLGVCTAFNSCIQNQRRKRQLALYGLQTYPQIMSYFQQQQQQEICTFYDPYSRPNTGICCTGAQNIAPILPAQQPVPEQPQELPKEPVMDMVTANNDMSPTDMPKDTDNSEDSEVLDADLNNYQPEPPKYDNTEFQDGNSIGYDPIDNLKQAQLSNQYNNYNNYIRYPWPQQFVGFSGVPQWPPPLPTHPPSIASWPPPLPTHPPNHHYPTHPPFSGGAQFTPVTTTTRRPFTTTTRRSTYPNYPTYRPTTTSTTTKRPPTAGDTGTTALGLPLQCGLKNAVNPDQERIVGGTNASPYEFPWITVLFKSGKQFCGGSLITNNHILTAAHCVARMTSWDVAALTANLGDYNIRTDFEVKHIERRIQRLVRHKGFDFSTLHNDIAILTLNEPVQYTNEIQPICLPTSTAQQTRSYSGQLATVAGWGSLRENGPQPSILQKVQIPIWTNSECASKYGRAAPAGIIDSMICAGQAAKDSCSGDSGGPLIVNEGGRYTQVGIVSWGIGCGKGQYPGVYTRVTSLLPWIYKNIK